MRKKIEYILSTSTFRQSLLATTTTVVTGGLGLAFYALLARYLGASLYGIVTLTLSVLTLVSDIGNIGSDTGLLSFIGKYSHNREKRNSFLTLALIIKCISLIILSLFGLLFSHSVSHFVFHKPFLEPYIFVFKLYRQIFT
jgi:O-antigen/teichoic acid export membrane protein